MEESNRKREYQVPENSETSTRQQSTNTTEQRMNEILVKYQTILKVKNQFKIERTYYY